MNEIGELRAISSHVLGASGIQIPQNNLDNLRSIEEEDGETEVLDPRDVPGSILLEIIDFTILGLLLEPLVLVLDLDALVLDSDVCFEDCFLLSLLLAPGFLPWGTSLVCEEGFRALESTDTSKVQMAFMWSVKGGNKEFGLSGARETMDGMDKEELGIEIVFCAEVSFILGEDECSEI
nr:hypothetical protein [Tanacetum cinerariifolium]